MGVAPGKGAGREAARRARRRRLLTVAVPGVVAGLLIGFAGGAIGGAAGVALVVVAILAAGVVAQVILRRQGPQRLRAGMQELVAPDAGPPPGVKPADSPLPGRWAAAYTAGDWEALRLLMADGFTAGAPGIDRRLDAGRYVANCRRIYSRYYTGTTLTVERCVAGEDPAVLWVRYAQRSVERGGRPLDSIYWERLQLDPAGERVLALDSAGVVSVA